MSKITSMKKTLGLAAILAGMTSGAAKAEADHVRALEYDRAMSSGTSFYEMNRGKDSKLGINFTKQFGGKNPSTYLAASAVGTNPMNNNFTFGVEGRFYLSGEEKNLGDIASFGVVNNGLNFQNRYEKVLELTNRPSEGFKLNAKGGGTIAKILGGAALVAGAAYGVSGSEQQEQVVCTTGPVIDGVCTQGF